MRIFYDTEFTDLSSSAELISAGFVSDLGQTFYVELMDWNRERASDFVRETVIPRLEGKPEYIMKKSDFVIRLVSWLQSAGPDLVLVSDSTWDIKVLQGTFAPLWNIQSLVPSLRLEVLAMSSDGIRRRDFAEAQLEYFLRHPMTEHHALHVAQALRLATLRREGH